MPWEQKFFAGPMYSAVGKARLVSTEQKEREWERAVTNLQKVCELAKSKDLNWRWNRSTGLSPTW